MTAQDPGEKVCDLVLSGGGVKAFALVGAVSVLLEAGYRVNRVAGTSSGAVVAGLVAAAIRADELLDEVGELDVEALADYRAPARVLPRWLGWPVTVLVWGELCRGERLRSWLTGAFGRRGIRSFEDFAPPPHQPTGRPPVTARDRLLVVAADISSGRLRRFPRDLAVYGPGTDLDVVDALLASAAVPYVFPPVGLPTRSGTHLLVDGGIASTVPVTVFDAPRGTAPQWPTFGISLRPLSDPDDVVYPTRGLRQFTVALVETARTFYDRLALDRPEVRERVIDVGVTEVSGLDFDLSPGRRRELMEAGRAAAREFLAGWDEQAHLGRRAAEAEAHRAADA